MLESARKGRAEGAGRPAAEEGKYVCVFSEQAWLQRWADLQLGPAVPLSELLE